MNGGAQDAFDTGDNAVSNVTPPQPTRAIPQPKSIINLHAPLPSDPEETIISLGEMPNDLSQLQRIRLIQTNSSLLKQFGYDVFSSTASTFAPVTNFPIPPDYVLGPYDSLIVNLAGKEFTSQSLSIDREGAVNIAGVGAVPIAGLTFAQASEVLKDHFESSFIGVEVRHITLGKMRNVRIFVLGSATQPGSYLVSGLTTMTNALLACGGVSSMGSLRNIQLKRDGKVIGKLDLYDLLLKGDMRKDLRIQEGDVIFIPPIGPTVGLSGAVKRPAIYELKGERNIRDVLSLAGGLLPNAYKKRVDILRSRGDKNSRSLNSFSLDNPRNMNHRVHNGDTVHVHKVLDKTLNTVDITGHVERPGIRQWSEGLRLSELIPDVSFLKGHPDLGYVLILRLDKRSQNWSALSYSLSDVWKNVGGASDPVLQARDKIYLFGLNENRAKSVAPIVQTLLQQKGSNELEPFVAIHGNVRFPGLYPYSDGMRVSQLLDAAVEALPGTDLDYALLVRTLDKDGRIEPMSFRLRDVMNNPGSPSDFPLRREDRLLVFTSSAYFENTTALETDNQTYTRRLSFPGQGEAMRQEFLRQFRSAEKKILIESTGVEKVEDQPSLQEVAFGISSAGSTQVKAASTPTSEEDAARQSFKSFAQGQLGSNTINSAEVLSQVAATSGLLGSSAANNEQVPETTNTDGDGSVGGVVPASREGQVLSDFERYNERERFKNFRSSMTDLPAFMTGRLAKPDRAQFNFLLIPGKSEELERYYDQWSNKTREGLLSPVLERLVAQATYSEPAQLVNVSGMVRFPGRYPLEKGMRVADLIRASGWLAEPAYTLEAEITRLSSKGGAEREMVHTKVDLASILDGDSAANIQLSPYDTLNIKPIPNWEEARFVSVKGEVMFPGVYTVRKGETLTQLLARVGGMTEFAYPQGAVFLRETLRAREAQEIQAMAQRLESMLTKTVLSAAESDKIADLGLLKSVIERLRGATPQGRLAIDLPAILEAKRSERPDVVDALLGDDGSRSLDIVLRDGDKLIIPSRSDEVTVLGEVVYPTSHQFRKDLTADDYLDLSGGLNSFADKKAMYVVRANGQVQTKRHVGAFGSAWFAVSDLELGPGDTLVVPIDAKPRMGIMEYLKEASSILYNLSVTAAALRTVSAL
ncbi:SLBB domain-containing protein [Magnetofaba australis]|uniref:Polysaccharide export protein n=1 Tax=Magnetofaba australis IT-1 TaxID=1434232 RepID=A0A1Y2K4J6_9PROT|nr:SLBB domain-containing protein [Magnetofaba australis]OSM04280.1 hypothetical protein MAIT1_04151 [Magnetofaba australis IT-1]